MVQNTGFSQDVVQEVTQEVPVVWDLSDKLSAVDCGISFLLLLLTGISVLCAYLAYRHQKARAKKDAACDLARIYADTILSEYQIVLNIFIKADLEAFVKTVFPMEKLDTFSFTEMKRFADRANVSEEDLKRKMEKIDPLIILDVFSRETHSVHERNTMLSTYSTGDKNTGKRMEKDGTELQAKYLTTVHFLANRLEWFSMKCRYGLADEKLLYQSLHQTFLSMVWRLYYFISRNNININDKYYTNTIWLFKKWATRLKKQNKRTKTRQRAALKQYENAGCEFAGKPLR